MNEYYVYVYIDPRRLEPFYYGKGKGFRKDAHEVSKGNSRMSKRINEICAAGEKPTIRVLVSDLTEEQALFIETAFIWQADGKILNKAPGDYIKHFRPHRTLHRFLPGFDSNAKVYYFNVGDGPRRRWEDYVEYQYIGAGHGERHRKAIGGLREGDIIAAYLTGRGYVGIARVTARAKPAREFRVNKKLLIDSPRMPEKISSHLSDDECEWMAGVKWIKTVKRQKAHFKNHAKLFAPKAVKASLSNQPKTIDFINERFGENLFKLANGRLGCDTI